MKRTNIYLDDEQVMLLDRISHDQGKSRAEVIRRLIDRFVSGETDDMPAGLTAIDDSFGVLADVDQHVRGSGERERHLARVWGTDS